ncbi:MAG: asparaginase [Acidobacteria bacterium]|nr:asparaginase [Acidobacteriota bacterium]
MRKAHLQRISRMMIGSCLGVIVVSCWGLWTVCGNNRDQRDSSLAERGSGALPLVKVLATGGTIANTPTGHISGKDLIDLVPEIKKYAQVEVEEVSRINSTDLTLNIWLELEHKIEATFAAEPQVDGIVISHGTNTLEETAYFLNLMTNSEKPVVLTAAQRRLNTPSPDGPKNLLDAIRVAASPKARGKGVLVVANDVINGAREVTKTISSRVETFSSRDLGALGYVDSDDITFYRAAMKRHTVGSEFASMKIDRFPRVEILYAYAGVDAGLVEAAATLKDLRGVVVAGFATGNVPTPMRLGLQKLAERGVKVVLSTRAGEGRIIPTNPYFAGLGFITADNLIPQKARILLMLGLIKTSDLGLLQRMFDQY